jgi:anti-anti-sigma factor
MTVVSTAPTYRADTDEVVLHVPCELDVATLPRTRAELDEVLAQRPARVVVDLSGCPFVDAAAMGVLLEAHRTTQRYGGELELRGCSPRVLRLLSLTGLGGVFHTTAA